MTEKNWGERQEEKLDITKDILEEGVEFSCWSMCFALTESGLISVNILHLGWINAFQPCLYLLQNTGDESL